MLYRSQTVFFEWKKTALKNCHIVYLKKNHGNIINYNKHDSRANDCQRKKKK